MLASLIAVLLCAQPPAFDDLRRALDAQNDEAVLEQLGAIRGADLDAEDRLRTARFLLDAAQRETRLSMALELGGLAVALDESVEGRLLLARLEIRASEYAAAARHLDQALKLNPEHREVLTTRAKVAEELADFERAAELYERLAALGDKEASARAEACRRQAAQERAAILSSSRRAPSPASSATPGARARPGNKRSKQASASHLQRERIAPAADKRVARPTRQLALRPVSDANFSSVVHGSDKPAIVLFEAPWCRPCLALHAALARLAPDHAERVNIVSLDIDRSPTTRQALSIRSIPQVLLFTGGPAPIALPLDPTPLEREIERRFSSGR